MKRYTDDRGEPRFGAIARDAVILFVTLTLVLVCWPFYSVPTGSRGVVTQFGRIVGIENEGMAVLPPWQKLSNFSIRAEQADIENAEGSTSDTAAGACQHDGALQHRRRQGVRGL